MHGSLSRESLWTNNLAVGSRQYGEANNAGLTPNFGPGYRIYFGKDGECIVIILCGGTKKRQQQDINAAKAYWQDYKTRKRKSK